MLVLLKMSIPDVLLIIAGEGPARRKLQKESERLGLTNNILFIGYLSRAGELLDCYCAGDAFVFASRTETQGLVLLEAMALGVPVVSTAVMGTKDILLPGKGAIVSTENYEDFSVHVGRILSDQTLRKRLSYEAREYVKEWTAQSMAIRLLSLYTHVAGKESLVNEANREIAVSKY
jgi:glycosyltransferase involved in cell wall biosynthesis